MRIIGVVAVTLALGAILVAGRGLPSVWQGMQPASCMPGDCFCEAVRHQLVRQPANALSGLAFVLVGLLALPGSRQSRQANGTGRAGWRPLGYLFALVAIALGAATVVYHASLTFLGQTLDVLAMYLLVTLLAASSVARRRAWPGSLVVAVYATVNTVLLVLLVAAPEYRRPVFGGLVVLALALEASGGRADFVRSRRDLWAAALVLLAGFAAWLLDHGDILCSPTSWVQGHAAWHLCAAAAVWLASRYYLGTAGRTAA